VVPRSALTLDKATQRFLRALSYYAALGIERLKLTREADRAEALQKADQVRNAVLASVSHDLRTPLTTIKALANEIRQTGDERAATIEEEADRLNRFVADLLDLSRLSGGALQVKPEINAAEDLIGAALQRVSGALHDRTVVASLDASEPLLLGRFDFVHSLRVLGNLIDNAIRFAPPESAVEVSARRQNGALEFAVADRGPGIPLADREFVFQPFYRGLAGAQDRGGVGLGLSIARGLAEAQRGMVRYEERLGGGSLFIFSVPAADVSELNGRED
jgi:two-component system sensor histidine kinase KdpD